MIINKCITNYSFFFFKQINLAQKFGCDYSSSKLTQVPANYMKKKTKGEMFNAYITGAGMA